jgi:pimeloyl-ACP methyl ester carboxylesterase
MERMDPVERLTGSGGVRLAFDRWGPSDGQPVLLLPGGGQTRHAWSSSAADLGRRGYHVLSLDLRGHGESDWSPGRDYGLSAFRDDLRAVIDSLDTPPALVGASLGGIAALLAAGESQAPIRALVLVDITPRVSVDGAARIRAFMTKHPDGFATVEDAAAAVAAYLPHRPRPKSPSGLLRNLRTSQGRLYWHWDPEFIEVTTVDGLSSEERLCAAARGVSAPTLLVRGDESEIVSEDNVRELVALMPRARVVKVKGARHMIAGDRNTAFGRALLGFLESVAPA